MDSLVKTLYEVRSLCLVAAWVTEALGEEGSFPPEKRMELHEGVTRLLEGVAVKLGAAVETLEKDGR